MIWFLPLIAYALGGKVPALITLGVMIIIISLYKFIDNKL